MPDDSTPSPAPVPLDYYAPRSDKPTDKPPVDQGRRRLGCVSAILAMGLLLLGCCWFYGELTDFSGERVWSYDCRQEGGLVVYWFYMGTKGGDTDYWAVSVCADAPPVKKLADDTRLDAQGGDALGAYNAITVGGKPMLKAWHNSKARCAWDTGVPIEKVPITQSDIDLLSGPAWRKKPLAELARALCPSLPATLPTTAPTTNAANTGQ